MGLTLAQQQAIAARGNILVTAGAGTGKTKTLVERCLHCLLQEKPEVSLEQILMVTFTEAAATEIRQRIRDRLEEQLRETPANLRWHEQLALFDRAHIGTLHSFCLQLVRAHFYELELDPQLAVLGEAEAQLLANETLTAVLDNHYSGRAPAAEVVQKLIQTQGGGSDQLVRALVFRLHHYMQTLADPAAWFHAQKAMFDAAAPDQWHHWLLEGFAEWRAEWLTRLHGNGNPDIASCAKALDTVQVSASRQDMAAALQNLIANLAQFNSGTRVGRSKWFKEFRAGAEFLLSLAAADGTTDPLVEDWGWVRDQMITLLNLAAEFTHSFSQNKRELGMVDFHDLEQHALRLLWDRTTNQPTNIAAEWRKKLRFLFVDEYQDINGAQDRIIEALGGAGAYANRFLVGDVKQGIYRFRLANPQIFQSYAANWRDASGRTFSLNENFRSSEGILNFINSLFSRIMRPELGGVDYDQRAQLKCASTSRPSIPGAAEPQPCVEVHVRLQQPNPELTPDQSPDEELSQILELEEAEKEARLVALRLRQLKAQQQPIWDDIAQKFRPLQWSDVAVLLRAPANKAESYAKEFSRLNVPLQVQRIGFYDSVEISDLISLLQILDNPLQDLPLLAVLHSPLVGLRASELATIRLAAKRRPFWSALVLWKESEVRNQKTESETLRKVNGFLDRFHRWRRRARQASLSSCLEAVLDETHYADWLLTQTRGEQRHANLQRLLAVVRQFDNFKRQGLFRFLCLIEAQRLAETEPEVKAISADNSVRLMSIHQGKGLEFPVVVVADLGKRFNLADLRAQIILDDRFGLCPQIKPPHTGSRYPSLPYWLAQRRQFKESLGEELRLLYVATTRARDLLLLSLSISETALQNRWSRSGENALQSPADASSCSDWLGLWLSEHVPDLDPRRSPGKTSLLRWFVHDERNLLAPVEIEIEAPSARLTPSQDVLNQLYDRLAWEYPFLDSTRTTAKASVTALRRRAAMLMDETLGGAASGFGRFLPQLAPQRPQTERSFAAEIGRAHHTFLQLVSLDRTDNLKQLQSELARMQGEQLLTPEEVASLDLESLAAFWNSPLGQRIRLQAPQVQRELPFTARFSPQGLAQITGEPAQLSVSHEFIIVQGVADLVVIAPENIWLVDFKTDAVETSEVNARAALYETQMKLYASALSRIYSRPVTECWLYFLRASKAVAVKTGEDGNQESQPLQQRSP